MVEVSPNLGCATYTLSINPCAHGPVTSTPDPAARPPSPTARRPAAAPGLAGRPHPHARRATCSRARSPTTASSTWPAARTPPAASSIGDVSRFNPTPTPGSRAAAAGARRPGLGRRDRRQGLRGRRLPGRHRRSPPPCRSMTSPPTPGASARPCPAAVEAAAGTALNGKFYVIGGDDYNTTLAAHHLHLRHRHEHLDQRRRSCPTPTGAPTPSPRRGRQGLRLRRRHLQRPEQHRASIRWWPTIPSPIPGPRWPRRTPAAWATMAASSPYGAGKLLVTDGGDGQFVPAARPTSTTSPRNTYSRRPAAARAAPGPCPGALPDGRVIVYGGPDHRRQPARPCSNTSELLGLPQACPSATPTSAPPTVTPTTPPATATRTAAPATATGACRDRDNAPPPARRGATADTVRHQLQRCPPDRLLLHAGAISGLPRRHPRLCRRHLPALQQDHARPDGQDRRARLRRARRHAAAEQPTPSPTCRRPTLLQPTSRRRRTPTSSAATPAAAPGEPCDAQNRPYFRPFANVTRGQLAKIVVVAAGWALINPATPASRTCSRTRRSTPSWRPPTATASSAATAAAARASRAARRSKPYFRQFNDATRGQIAKIVYGALTSTQTCATP